MTVNRKLDIIKRILTYISIIIYLKEVKKPNTFNVFVNVPSNVAGMVRVANKNFVFKRILSVLKSLYKP